jgi:rSAM/selenodomain-associated transferase 1
LDKGGKNRLGDHACQHAVVALFVRLPVPGRVKTRLAHDLGDEAACDLYRAMVADIIANITACGLQIYLFHDGQDSVLMPKEWLDAAADVLRQRGDSLGERMTAAFEYLFSIGREQVILTGSDIPGIDALLLRSAIDSIEGCDVVISPALDGGYCLVASKKADFNSTIFMNIPWSTSRVLEATLDACKAGDVKYTLIKPRQDIDTLNDIKIYCRQPSVTALSTNHWLVSHGYMMQLPNS